MSDDPRTEQHDSEPGAQDTPTVDDESSPNRPAQEISSRRFGDYELYEEIARGGMGVVYRARQMSVDRRVALKMILAGKLADANEEKRFLTEANAAANLDHPNIVPIYDVGEHDGQKFFSMKLIDGATLSQYAAGRKLRTNKEGLRSAVELVATVAKAVHHAHQCGIIHRDLKPGNILIDSEGRPHVTDFGLAKKIEGGEELTQSGAVLGTPEYMAPEQARAEKVLTTAVDVYSLGAILYKMLTGKRLFTAENIFDLLKQVVESEPIPPSRHNPLVDASLETICLKCLDKRPAQRYGSALELAEDLERWLRHEPIHARPVGNVYRAVLWCRRNPAIAALIGAVAASLVLGSIVATLFGIDARAQAENARKKEKLATEEKLAADKARLQADAERNRAEELVYSSDTSLALLEWLDDNFDEARRILNRTQWDRRGWEHDWLSTRFHAGWRLIGVDSMHLVNMNDICFSPNGKLFVTAGGNLSFKIFDAQLGVELRTFKTPTGPSKCVCFSPDGQIIAGGCGEFIRLWNVQTGIPIVAIKNSSPINSLCFHPDGISLVSGGAAGDVKLWDAKTGKLLRTLSSHKKSILAVRVSSDGKTTASACSVGIVRIRTEKSKELTFQVVEKSRQLNHLCFDGNCKRAVSVGPNHAVSVWDATVPKLLWKKQPNSAVGGLAFTPDGKHLVLSTGYGIEVLEADTGRTLRILKGHHSFGQVCFRPDGQMLGAVNQNRGIVLQDFDYDQDGLILENGYSEDIAFHPNGMHIAGAMQNGIVGLWDAQTGKQLRTLTKSKHVRDPKTGRLAIKAEDMATCIAYHPKGKYLIGGNGAMPQPFRPNPALGKVTIWDGDTGKKLRVFSAHRGPVLCIGYSSDGELLATGGLDKAVKLWDTESARLRQALPEQFGAVNCFAFSPDGKLLACGSGDSLENKKWLYAPKSRRIEQDGRITIWNAESGRKLRVIKAHENSVIAIQFSQNGQTVLSAGDLENSAKLWDVENGKHLFTFRGPELGNVVGAVFSPDGSRVFSSYPDRIVIWDAKSKRHVLTIRSKQLHARDVGAIGKIQFSGDGNRLALVSSTNVILNTDRPPGVRSILCDLPWHFDTAAVSKDGTLLAAIKQEYGTSKDSLRRFQNEQLVVWSLRSGRELITLDKFKATSRSKVAFHPTKQRLAALLGKRKGYAVRMWDTSDFSEIGAIKNDNELYMNIRYTPDGKYLAVTTQRQNVVPHPEIAKRNPPQETPLSAIKLFDAETAKFVHTITEFRGWIFPISFSADGSLVAAAGDKKVRIWDAETGEAVSTIDGFQHPMGALSLSPNGNRLAFGVALGEPGGGFGRPKNWQVWIADAKTGRVIHKLREQSSVISSVDWSPDGKHLATGSQDGTLRLWQAATGELLAVRYQNVVSGVRCKIDHVRFFDGGQHILTVGVTANIWDIPRILPAEKQHRGQQ